MGTYASEMEMRREEEDRNREFARARRTREEIEADDRRERPPKPMLSPAASAYLRSIKQDIARLGREVTDHEVKREWDQSISDHLRTFLVIETLLTLGDLRGLIFQATKYIEEKRGG